MDDRVAIMSGAGGIGNNGGKTVVSPAMIQKLNGGNYLPWKRQVTIALKLQGLEEAIELDTGVETKKDMEAILFLLATMDEAHQTQAQAEVTARQMMLTLDKQYADRSSASKHRLMLEFMTLRKDLSDNVHQHVSKLKERRIALSNLGENFSDEFFQCIVINSLPSEFGNLADQWDTIHSSMKTNDFLLSLLQKREKELAVSASAFAVKTQRSSSDNRKMSIEERKKMYPCHKCHKKGHWAAECTENSLTENKVTTGKAKQDTAKIIFNVAINHTPPRMRDEWLLDSGASDHMSNNRKYFKSLRLFEKPAVATVGNGQQIKIMGYGDVDIACKVLGTTVFGTLKDVNYIPDLSTNLVSVGKCASNKIFSTFTDKEVQLKLEGEIVMVGSYYSKNLYMLDIEVVCSEDSQILMMQGTRSADEWHQVFGHASQERIEKLVSDKTLDLKITGELNSCGTCPASKGQHASHPSRLGPRASLVGERIHIDLGHDNNKEAGVYYYYLLCKDEFTEFTMVYFLENKGQTAEAIAKLMIEFERISGCPVLSIHSDNGSELKNRKIELLCLREKVLQTFSAPYTPPQNGVIEREMKSINNMARAMLLNANLGLHLTPEAIRTAVYLKNRLPTKNSDLTPYEKLTGRKPYVKHLVIFGARVQILDNSHRHGKFEPRTVDGYVTGFTDRRNTYRVFVPAYKKVIETCDVYFSAHRRRELEKVTAGSEQPANCGPIRWEPSDSRQSLTDNDKSELATGSAESVKAGQDDAKDDVKYDGQHMGGSSRMKEESLIDLEDEYDGEEIGDVPHDKDPLPNPDQTGAEWRDGKWWCIGDRLAEFFEKYREQECLPEDSEAEVTKEAVVTNVAGASENVRSTNLLLVSMDTQTPQSYKEALSGTNRTNWEQAVESELNALEKNETWKVVDRPKAGTTLTARWVFALKRDASGKIERFKARLVARGFQQRAGIDYFETFAPVARVESIRLILALAAAERLHILQFDVATAFLNGKIDEDLYIEPPEGLQISKEKCLKLEKALYGLKQAPRAWNEKLNQTLYELGLEPTDSDKCVYTDEDKSMFVLIYVDDGLIVGRDEAECRNLLMRLKDKFETKELKAEVFVGIEITQTNGEVILTQTRYIYDLAERFEMSGAKETNWPNIDPKVLQDENNESRPTKAPYRELIGSLIYLANATRPDIFFSVNLLAKYNQAPKDVHWRSAKKVLSYVISSANLGLRYKPGVRRIDAYSDADWASSDEQRHSISGTLVKLAGGPIIFRSLRQSPIALSTTEAEYYAANEAVKELAWLNQMLTELGYDIDKPRLHIDNASTIQLIKNIDTKRRSKHIEIKYHYIREKYAEKLFQLEHIPTLQNPADALTKPLTSSKVRLVLDTEILVENKMKGKGNHKGGKMAMLALACIAMLALGAGVESFRFEPTDPLIFVPTQNKVQLGVYKWQVDYLPLSPCNFSHIDDWQSEQNIKRISYEMLRQDCERKYSETVLPAFRELAKCLPRDEDKASKKNPRKKRVIDPISLAIFIGIGVVFLVSIVATAAYSYWSPDSSYNRLNRMEEREKERDATIQNLKEKLERAYNVRESMINELDNITGKVESNTKAISQLAKLSGPISITAANLSYGMDVTRNMLREMVRQCRKERAAPVEYAELFKIEKFRELESTDTHLTSIGINERGVLGIDLYATINSVDTEIYELVGIPYWVNATTSPSLMTYTGPKYVMHNFTSDCSKGLDDPKEVGYIGQCTEVGFRDKRISEWTSIPEAEAKELKPVVVRAKTESIIYCLYFDITIGNSTVACPPFPFKLEIDVPFKIKGYEHLVVAEKFHHVERRINFVTPTFDVHNHNGDYTSMIKKLRQLNKESMEPEFTLTANKVTIPLGTGGILSVLTIGASLVTLGSCIMHLIPRLCANQGNTASEHINVINTAPPQQAPFIQSELPTRYPILRAPTDSAATVHYAEILHPETKGTLAQIVT